ncbi:MAG: NAD(P)H-dependent oxidoreductase [Candidatus Peregrinibacteria bacterium]
MSKPLNIVGISGSLRKGSFNTALLHAAQDLVPEGAALTILEIGDLPLFNQDLEANPPASVLKLKEMVKAADALLLVTPEYNYSVSGVLKNALDWISRPYGQNSADSKPVAIMSASGGMTGGLRAQYHLRQILVFFNASVLNRPEVMVPSAQDKFDAAGKLIDEKTKEKVAEMIIALVDWTKKMQGL